MSRRRWLQAGVLLWMALAGTVMVPLVQVRNSAVYLSAAYLSVLLLVFAARVLSGRVRVGDSQLDVPLLAVAATAVISAAQGVAFYDPSVQGVHRYLLVEIYAAALACLSAGAALVVADQVDDVAALHWMFRIIVGVAVWVLLQKVVPFVMTPQWWPLIVVHAAALLYARLLYDPPRRVWQVLLAAAFVVYVLARIVLIPFVHPAGSQWLSGWIALGGALGFITLVRAPRLAIPLFAVAGAGAGYVWLPQLRRMVDLAAVEGDFNRLYIWQDALRICLTRPIFGVGPGNYMDYAERYARVDFALASAHGNYQQLAAEMGLVGLAFLLWVLLRAFFIGMRLERTLHDGFLRGFVVGIMGSVAGQALAATVGDYLIPAYHNGGHTHICVTLYTWMMLGALMAIEKLAKRRGPAAGGAL